MTAQIPDYLMRAMIGAMMGDVLAKAAFATDRPVRLLGLGSGNQSGKGSDVIGKGVNPRVIRDVGKSLLIHP